MHTGVEWEGYHETLVRAHNLIDTKAFQLYWYISANFAYQFWLSATGAKDRQTCLIIDICSTRLFLVAIFNFTEINFKPLIN